MVSIHIFSRELRNWPHGTLPFLFWARINRCSYETRQITFKDILLTLSRVILEYPNNNGGTRIGAVLPFLFLSLSRRGGKDNITQLISFIHISDGACAECNPVLYSRRARVSVL